MRSFIGLDLSAQDKLALENWREKSLPGLPSSNARNANQPKVPVRQPKPVPAANFHITLCFLGNINDRQHETVIANLDDVTATPFEVTLDMIAFWQGPKILLAAPTAPPASLMSLAASVNSAARQAGIDVERREYRPHVTLIRNTKEDYPPPLFAPQLTCQFSQFHLFESVSTPSGVRYPVKHSWPLRSSHSVREKLQRGHF